MYGENTKTIVIPIYRVLPYPVIIVSKNVALYSLANATCTYILPCSEFCGSMCCVMTTN